LKWNLQVRKSPKIAHHYFGNPEKAIPYFKTKLERAKEKQGRFLYRIYFPLKIRIEMGGGDS
jgi:hypothetical protein